MEDNSVNNIISSFTFPQQPWEVKTEKTYNDYIVECAMRMFTNINFDVSTSRVSVLAKDCISRSKTLIDGLVKMGFITKK